MTAAPTAETSDTRDARHEAGRSLRRVVARSAHAEWSPAASRREELAAAVAGVGILLTPDFVVAEELREKTLRRVLTPWTPSDYSVFALSPPTRFATPKARAFVEFLGQALSSSAARRTSARAATRFETRVREEPASASQKPARRRS